MLGLLARLALVVLVLSGLVHAATAPSSSSFTNNWAVLVCTSRFWFNYRHMANTLAMYRTVKRLGIPDSQIILMLADDAACNPRNPFAATVYSNADRKTDLYGDRIEVDYKGEEVSVETFLRLLSGRLPESTPASKRLMTDERSNIFVYMTGHGGDEFLKFQDNEEISAFDLADAFGGMWAKKRYNEIFFMVDTCQANTLYSKFYSPNILATGSSEKDQNSYSHHADNDIGVAVTDRYTHHVLTFLETINKTSKVTMQNLFDTFSFEIIHSTPGVRDDLFPRRLDETLLTDFFGGSLRAPWRSLALAGPSSSRASAPLAAAAAGSPSSLSPSTSTSHRSFCSCPSLRYPSVPRPARAKPPSPAPRLKRGKSFPPSAPQTELFDLLDPVPAVRSRPTLINEDSARDLVRAWGVDKMHDVTVVDCWAGPGGLTRAFLELPNVKKVIAIEESFRYKPMLDLLKHRHGDRIAHVQAEPFQWETYNDAEKDFKDLVPKLDFDQVHPNLFLSAQLPSNVYGNLMFVQMVSAIAGRMWYYQYGRFELGVMAPDTFLQKVLAKPGDPGFHKLSILLPTLASIQRVATMGGFKPPENNFHKPRGDPGFFGAVKVTPLEKPLVQNFDALEFVARNMFVTRAVLWHKALSAVAPGALNLVDQCVQRGLTDMKKTVQQLTLEEWIIIADVFEDWPFRPQTLFDTFDFNTDRI
ncbi:hypothetical protein JCM8097_000621 [Rhodosporidiobolus ruineniae]